jgi:GNAT superfamily N-acetyltransferase
VFDLVDTSSFKVEYPEALSGAWVYYVFFKNHETLDGLICGYFNDKHPSGSVYVGDYVLNDYPDVYGTWKKDNESGNNIMDRIAVSPILRKKGVGSAALYYGATLLEHLYDKKFDHAYGSKIGNKTYSSAFNVDSLVEVADEENVLDLKKEFFDQPLYPNVFFGRMVSE